MVGDVADLGAWVREATRVLAPGGHLIYSDFHPSWAAGAGAGPSRMPKAAAAS